MIDFPHLLLAARVATLVTMVVANWSTTFDEPGP
jgi:hypothetical protein